MAFLSNVFCFLIIILFAVYCLKHALGVKTSHMPIELAKAFNISGPLAAILAVILLVIAAFYIIFLS